MESNLRLLLMRLLLACIIIGAILTVDAKKHNKQDLTTDSEQKHHHIKISKSHKHTKKAKRSAYSRGWSSKEYNYMPPYLVYNRKTGAYHPYYSQTQGNNIRRNMVKNTRQNGFGARNYNYS